MAAKEQKSKLNLSKYNVKQVHDAHRNDEVKISQGGDLPAGIEGGVAKISECKIGVYKEGTKYAGESYFMAMAIVEVPDAHKGGITKIGPEPLCETTTAAGEVRSFESHWTKVLNWLRLCGATDAVAAMEDPDTELPLICEAVKQSGIYIKFRTWAGSVSPQYPTPSVNHDWRGIAEGYVSEVEDDVTEEAPPAKAAPVKKTVPAKTAPPAAAPVKKAAVKAPPAKVAFENVPREELAERADQGGEEEQYWLKKKALSYGISEDDIDNADNWAAVAQLIEDFLTPAAEEEAGPDLAVLGEQADAGDADATEQLTALATERELDPNDFPTWAELATALDEGSQSDDADAWQPGVGEVYKYKWFDVKTKKPGKPVECEVIKVDPAKQTVSLKNLASNQVMQNIGWAQLEQ